LKLTERIRGVGHPLRDGGGACLRLDIKGRSYLQNVQVASAEKLRRPGTLTVTGACAAEVQKPRSYPDEEKKRNSTPA